MRFATAILLRRHGLGLLAVATVCCCCLTGYGQEVDFPKAARRAYWTALESYQGHTNDLRITTDFARACFDVGEFATNSTERASVAEQGIAAARQALTLNADSPAAHFYLAMNLGQLARTRGIGALKLVSQMEKEFLRVTELDPHFEHAGAHRCLGVLYRDAPSIASVGNRLKSKHHLGKAVELEPNYPENRIALIEASLIWHDRNTASREFKALEQLLPEARKQFTGPDWAASWADWDARIAIIRKKMEPDNVLTAPRQKG